MNKREIIEEKDTPRLKEKIQEERSFSVTWRASIKIEIVTNLELWFNARRNFA